MTNAELEQRVLALVDERQDEILRLVSELVRIPSVTGSEGEAQAFIEQKLLALGCRVDTWDPDLSELKAQPEYQPIPDDYGGRPNVVGVLGGTGGGKSIILNGHIDVVSPGSDDGWDHGGPWSGAIENGKLYGRGSTDMKSGLACFIQAVETLQALDVQLRGDVVIESVVDEERGGNGTLAAVLRGYRADGAILGEPTNMALVTANAGVLWVRLTVKGKAAHGAHKQHGVNAIDKAMYLYQELLKYEAERQERLADPLFGDTRYPFPLSLGSFRSGDWPSIVPDVAVMEGRVGFSPAEDHNEFRREFEATVADLAQKDPWLAEHPPEVEWYGLFMDSARIESDHPLVTTAEGAMTRILRHPPEHRAKTGGTDMRLLANSGTPCIQIGPGVSSEAHTVNEWVPVQNIVDTTKILCLILLRWCGVD